MINITLTGPYDYMKERSWTTFGDMTVVNYTLALLWASLWSSLVTLPVDNIRTRVMTAFPDLTKNRIQFKNMPDLYFKIFINEGWKGLYVGYYTYFIKTLVFCTVTVAGLDCVTRQWKINSGLKEWQIWKLNILMNKVQLRSNNSIILLNRKAL